jgi:hypothetical protein
LRREGEKEIKEKKREKEKGHVFGGEIRGMDNAIFTRPITS